MNDQFFRWESRTASVWRPIMTVSGKVMDGGYIGVWFHAHEPKERVFQEETL